jgi:hypothetical protein
MRITIDIPAGMADRGALGALGARVRRTPLWMQVDAASVTGTGGVAP